MKRFAFALLMVACAEELPNAAPPELHDIEHASAMVKQAASAVVRIQHPAGGSATGSFISPDGLLLTNAHVLGGDTCAREGCAVALSFEYQRGTLALSPRGVWAVPQHVDVGLDMAAVQIFLDEAKTQRINTPFHLTLAPRTASELVGTHVTAIGHPLGRLKKWSSGYVVSADGTWFDASVFSLPGGSGSPLLDDAGQLVGLLHRGAEGFDLLTRTSAEVTAVASASADVQRALAAPLPTSVFSLADSLSADQALANSGAFLAAHTWKANVDGQPVSLAWLLGTDCDEALAYDDYESYEAFQGAISSCFAALEFIECRTDLLSQNKENAKECPRGELAVWSKRLQTAMDKQQRFNGSLDLTAISYSMEGLSDTVAAGEQAARTNLLATLDRFKPRLDFTIGSYLAAYAVESYDNQSVRELFLNYRTVPFYERYAFQIATAMFWLHGENQLTRAQALGAVKALYRDSKVSIGAKLRIEDLLHASDEL
ncbi:MAG: serine protease [Polyangiales bacterium]